MKNNFIPTLPGAVFSALDAVVSVWQPGWWRKHVTSCGVWLQRPLHHAGGTTRESAVGLLVIHIRGE